ncbi:MAG: NYN domain-containing protein [Burkholderiales bacterium]|nr:NYN domain-containing protein [Burkholderiales bacterium]
MAAAEINNMAVFCDFENVALGVQDAKYDKFSIKTVLEKLLVKGSIVVKKAYCDWERYKSYKAGMHEAAFELIEIPHVRQSGKNSADIRLVVDALDLCYTKSHVDTFVIISGDSDFSPLVSKLRENNKRVIGVGVKASTSDLLIKNCDEFIFYDDLVRVQEAKKKSAEKKAPKRAEPKKPEKPDRRGKEEKTAGPAAPQAAEAPAEDEATVRRQAAIDLVMETLEELIEARGSDERIYSSMVKQALKRRRPEFNESYHGYKGFAALLDDMVARGLLVVSKDEKTGQHLVRLPASGPATD